MAKSLVTRTPVKKSAMYVVRPWRLVTGAQGKASFRQPLDDRTEIVEAENGKAAFETAKKRFKFPEAFLLGKNPFIVLRVGRNSEDAR